MSHSDNRATSIVSDDEIKAMQAERDLENRERDARETAVYVHTVKPFFHTEKRFCIDKRGHVTMITYNREGFPIASVEEIDMYADGIPSDVLDKAREIGEKYAPPAVPRAKVLIREWMRHEDGNFYLAHTLSENGPSAHYEHVEKFSDEDSLRAAIESCTQRNIDWSIIDQAALSEMQAEQSA